MRILTLALYLGKFIGIVRGVMYAFVSRHQSFTPTLQFIFCLYIIALSSELPNFQSVQSQLVLHFNFFATN